VLEQLTQCQNASINGYSALGAAMLAPDISFEKRRVFIRELIKYGFKSTLRDMQLAELILYDEIMKEERGIGLKSKKLKIKFIHLLHSDSSAPWRVLPKELRKLIAQYMIQVLKKEEDCWLLPGF
jgi:hypothetical protein